MIPFRRNHPLRRPLPSTGASNPPPCELTREAASRSLLTRPWKPWQAGLAIGVVVVLSLISSAASGRNYPIGITHGVLHVQELVTDNQLVHVFGPPVAAVSPSASPAPVKAAAGAKKITWWLVLVTGGLFFGALPRLPCRAAFGWLRSRPVRS